VPARRRKLYYLMDSDAGSKMKFSPPVVNMALVKAEGEEGAGKKEDKGKGKGKGKKKG